jgi:hypothetical protein
MPVHTKLFPSASTLALLPLAVMLPGCIFGGPPRGIWLLTFIFDDETTSECETTISENFIDGYIPGADSPNESDWTTTYESDPPDALGFAQIETTDKGHAVLIFGGAAYPGAKEEDGWVFSWSAESTDTMTMEHVSGYDFIDETFSSQSLTLSMADEGSTAHGVLRSEALDTRDWMESDGWSEAVADDMGATGQIPSAKYLVYLDDNDNERPQANEQEEDDCEGDLCELGAETVCSLQIRFDAVKTDFHEEEAYSHLGPAGQGGI